MNNLPKIVRCATIRTTSILNTRVANYSSDIVDRPDDPSIKIPEYSRENETLEKRKARLLYQSRKRGMLENDLLLSTFAGKYLKDMNEEQVEQYDRLINKPSNDWEIYYWGTGMKPIPKEFDNEVMRLFVQHVKSGSKRGEAMRQPDI